MQALKHETKEAAPNAAPERDGTFPVTPEAAREQAERILVDPLFRYSQRASNLLRFVVDRTLRGQTDELKERIIGIQVFGRVPDYDTSNDSTVRVVANEVRKRLAQYYSKSEHEQEIRIEIPVRSYLAEFRLPQPNAPVPDTDAQPAPAVKVEPAIGPQVQAVVDGNAASAPDNPRTFSGRYTWAILAALVIALAAWKITGFLPVSAIGRFWKPIVNTSRPVLVCVGSPLEDSSPDPAETTEAANPKAPFYDLESHVNVGMKDVTAAEALAEYLRRTGTDSVVRPLQGADLADVRYDPVILYGMYLNEWADRLGADLHFRFRKDSEHGLRWIQDPSNPAARSWAVNISTPYGSIDSDYALITRIRDQTTGRWWVGIAGLTGVGTIAANQLVMDPKAMTTLAGQLPTGWYRKNLQVVLGIKIVQGNPGATKILATYSW